MPGSNKKRKSFVLRIRPEDYAALERWAGDEFRSINGQMEYLLHEALRRSGRLPQAQEGQQNQEQDGGSDAQKDSK